MNEKQPDAEASQVQRTCLYLAVLPEGMRQKRLTLNVGKLMSWHRMWQAKLVKPFRTKIKDLLAQGSEKLPLAG